MRTHLTRHVPADLTSVAIGSVDLRSAARWRARAISVGAGAVFVTGGSMVVGWAPSAMASAPMPASQRPADSTAPDAVPAAKQHADADNSPAAKARKAADHPAAADGKALDRAAKDAKTTAKEAKKRPKQAPPPQSGGERPDVGAGSSDGAGLGTNPGRGDAGGELSTPPGPLDSPPDHNSGNNGNPGSANHGNPGQGNQRGADHGGRRRGDDSAGSHHVKPSALPFVVPLSSPPTPGGASGAGLLIGQSHALGEEIEVSPPMLQQTQAERLENADRTNKMRVRRVQTQPLTARSVGGGKSVGSTVSLLLLLLIVGMLTLGRRFANTVRHIRPAATAGTLTQIRWV